MNEFVIMLWYCVLDVVGGRVIDVVTKLGFLPCRGKGEGLHGGWTIFEVDIWCLGYVGECAI